MVTREMIIKELENKARACSLSNKESRARKGAYVDAILIIKEKLHNPPVDGCSKLLLDFANKLNESAGFPLNSEGFEEFINDFLSKQNEIKLTDEITNNNKLNVSNRSYCECGNEMFRDEIRNLNDGMYYCECGKMH